MFSFIARLAVPLISIFLALAGLENAGGADLTEVHAALSCLDCHDSAWMDRFDRAQPARGSSFVPGSPLAMEQMPLAETQILELSQKCSDCHEDQAQAWNQSAHATTYREIFLNRDHNHLERLNQDCLRCHGMFYAGGIEQLVEPISTEGPWKIKIAGWEQKPAIPCLACHQAHPDLAPRLNHQSGEMILKANPGTNQLTGFYERREKAFWTLQALPHPKVQESEQWLMISPDQRLRLCYQCHAPRAGHQAGTSDDKTPRGVHAGLSCLACHETHRLSARNSCQACHPKNSHCGLEVRLMDTSFNAKASRHDIHTVHCEDCHQGKRPDGVKR